MPAFRYSAMDRDGKAVSGSIDADNRAGAIAALAAGGSFVTRIDTAEEVAVKETQFSRRRVPLRAKVAMLEQLAVALQSGLPLLEAVRVVRQQAENRALESLCDDLGKRLQAGESLSEAIAAHPLVFRRLDVAMTRVGEAAGQLDQVMGHLAEFARRDHDVRTKVRSALAYPIFVLSLALLSVIIVLTFILPRIMDTVLEHATASVLPWPTRVLLAASDFIHSFYAVIALALAAFAVVSFLRWARTAEGRLQIDTFKLRLPVLGPSLRKLAVARFARTLGTLSRAGIPIIEAMNVLRDTLGNEALAVHVDRVRADITQGRSIAEPLRQTGQFPPLLVQVIAMGERTGKLDDLLLKAADSLEADASVAITRLMTILPALLIVGLALIVLFVLAAVLLPIMNLDVVAGG